MQLNYYDKLYELLDGLFNEQLDEFETDERVLAHLDEYLTTEEGIDEKSSFEYGYTSAAEHLLDNWDEDHYRESGEEMIRCAKREVEIFRKHGMNRMADRIQRQLRNIEEQIKEGWD